MGKYGRFTRSGFEIQPFCKVFGVFGVLTILWTIIFSRKFDPREDRLERSAWRLYTSSYTEDLERKMEKWLREPPLPSDLYVARGDGTTEITGREQDSIKVRQETSKIR